VGVLVFAGIKTDTGQDTATPYFIVLLARCSPFTD